MTKSKKEFLAGYDLVWGFEDTPNYLGGQGSLFIGVSRDGSPIPRFLGVLAILFNLQFPFTDTITCECCKRDASTLDAAHAKGALVRVAFDQAGINLWDGKTLSPPSWSEEKGFDYLYLCIDAWSKLTKLLLDRSWNSGAPAALSIKDVATYLQHHERSWFGLRTEQKYVTPDQARLFISTCKTYGLLNEADPGPGGELFGNSLKLPADADVLTKAYASMVKSRFSRPIRPANWRGAVQGFSTRCYDCTVAANPILQSRIQPLSSIE